ncbi:STAS domain-containing protein [Lacinutrix iliipiscaria]|uniref:STAS domain-containing protein n=1 Tax=Lacinutrix iliipiscaria TaxID=1230532 RepID=A0ABW5WJI6_9FLAO
MALEISNFNEAFEIKGTLNESNVKKFQSHFKDIFNTTNQLVINIDQLESVDQVGVLAFEELYKQSLIKHKRFYITGLGSRDMFEHLRTIDAA